MIRIAHPHEAAGVVWPEAVAAGRGVGKDTP